jgi:hypothetical protein
MTPEAVLSAEPAAVGVRLDQQCIDISRRAPKRP